MKKLVLPFVLACLALLGSDVNPGGEPAEDVEPKAGDRLSRPEETASFLREKGVVLTIRRSGEFTTTDQVTLYKEHSQVMAIVRGESVAPDSERVVDEKRCSDLEEVWDDLVSVPLDFRPSTSFYAPPITYQIWASSLLEERFARLYAPDPSAEGTAYWGSAHHTSSKAIEVISESFRSALSCIQPR